MKEIMTASATPAQVSAFLVALRFNPMTPEVLYTSASAMGSFAVSCDVYSSKDEIVVDIVGTGGDAHDTFNASTASAFVVAACGIKVAKHGNRSSSGRCGSADLIEALGAKLDIECEKLPPIIKKLNFGFLFAQKFHPAMKSVGPIRKDIGIRTIFNMLGPLSNPAKPNYMLVGVGTHELGELYSKVFAMMSEVKRVMIVHSLSDGLDEITTSGKTKVWMVENGTIKVSEIAPSDFGLEEHKIESILGSTPAENVKTFNKLINGDIDNHLKPVLDFVMLQASAALVVAGKAKDFKEGAQLALEAIRSKKVHSLVQDYINLTNGN